MRWLAGLLAGGRVTLAPGATATETQRLFAGVKRAETEPAQGQRHRAVVQQSRLQRKRHQRRAG